MMEVCGALSDAVMLAGCKQSKGVDHPGETKGKTYKVIKKMADTFQEQNETYICRELKGVTDGKVRRVCAGCISDACQLIEEYLLN